MQGKIIVLEGIDGSGKNTHAKLLQQYLISSNFIAKVLHFPLYQETFFGNEVANYLNGKYGDLKNVHPKLAAMLYAGDRYEKKSYILQELKKGTFFIFDRYVPSNIAHHAAKLDPSQWMLFKKWIETLEYNVYKLPFPNKVYFLDVPPKIAMELVLNKEERTYTHKKQDLHEENLDYMNEVYKVFSLLCDEDSWTRIICSMNDTVKSIEEIQKELRNKVVNDLSI